jgi:hypothetical protein
MKKLNLSNELLKDLDELKLNLYDLLTSSKMKKLHGGVDPDPRGPGCGGPCQNTCSMPCTTSCVTGHQ